MKNDNKAFDVLVVGGGPVGLALVGDLAWRGIRCALIEKGSGIVEQPRMDMVGIRTMEFCRRWGLIADVESAGYNRDYPQDCAWVTGLNGYEFGREPFPAPRVEKCPPQSPQKRERCPQNFFDPVLRRFAERGGASLFYHRELVDFRQADDGVVATVCDPDTGAIDQIEAAYIVGADGAASKVKSLLGIEMSGEPVLTYTTNVVFRAPGLEQLHDKRPAYRYIFIGPEGTWATLVAINGRDEWRFSLIGDERFNTITEAEARQAIERAVGRRFDFEILSMLPWVRRQLVANSYGGGRAFIVGDAAHLTSPTGGFGMNTGILDAVNLGWKLAAVIQGWGVPALLETYEIEQRPVAIRNVTEAGDNLKRMLSPRISSPDAVMFDADNPAAEAARIEYGDRYTEMMKREWFSIGIHLGYVYEGSPIVVPDGTPPPPDVVQQYEPTSRPGSRAPHFWLSDGRSVLDLFGREFVLLLNGIDDTACQGLMAAAATRGVPISSYRIDNDAGRAAYSHKLTLVRPDGQVAWRSDTPPVDAAAIIDIVRGATMVERTRPVVTTEPVPAGAA